MKQASRRQKDKRAPGRTARSSTKASSSTAPLAISRPIRSKGLPQINSRQGSVRISHTEYFYPVVRDATGVYKVDGFPIQPGLQSCFPWLAPIAQRFESYRFNSLVFDYYPRCATTSGGVVGLVVDFDALDAPPATELEALTYHDKVADAPWKEMSLRVDLRSDRLPMHYTRGSVISGSHDLKTYDLGNLFVFSAGLPSNPGMVGVTYSIDFFTPQTENPTTTGTARATTGLTHSTLVGSDFGPMMGAQKLPVERVDDSTIRFLEPFEGILNMSMLGSAFTGPLVASFTGSGLSDELHGVNAGTSLFSVQRIKASAGELLSYALTAATGMTMVDWDFSKGSYDLFA